ncbi:hypothetical protein KY285_027534 [Solanum tuberosum]|nr:hypothetical protein KY289_027733 [Solanum tuberosum]KAH0666328.1 hypothetical protein KY285_027534 [Solanum tuberosum]
MSEVKYKVAKFNDDSDFSTWQRRMRDLLIQQHLHKALGGKSKKPESNLGIGKKWMKRLLVQSGCT